MDPTPAVDGLATAIQAITQVVTAAVGWVGQYMGAITAEGNELLMIFFAMPLIGEPLPI